VVAQIDEQQAAMVALAMDPAGQADGSARVLRAQRATGVGAIGVHGENVVRSGRSGRERSALRAT
jgi:hypothetical protein